MTANPTDAENLYYAGRQYALLGASEKALNTLARSIDGGYYCCESLTNDPAFDDVRDATAFRALVARAQAGRDAALAAFHRAAGGDVLGI